MFNRDCEFWSQLAAYLSALIVVSADQLLMDDNLELSLNFGVFLGWIARGLS
ncbi:hypothetical protein SAMN05216338_1001333 [Bradyrhizobium sp. Rc2d]|nr:hypothetical protein SAMN05216338_1001333 [Bradyrhizobium sp. Rc2d]